MTQDGIVVTERGGQLINTDSPLHIHQNVVGFVNFVDGIGQLTTAPVFKAVNSTPVLVIELCNAPPSRGLVRFDLDVPEIQFRNDA